MLVDYAVLIICDLVSFSDCLVKKITVNENFIETEALVSI